MSDGAADGDEAYGYLMVHFVEDPDGYGEQIHLSLSRGDDPLAWDRLNGGQPILRSDLGTTGVRDPVLVRSPTGDGFTIVATDLRIYGGDDAGWDTWSRRGSRSLVIWDSPDLVTWSEPRLVEVSPPGVGMTWAPEVILDDETGEYIVYWSSSLFDHETDPEHTAPSYSRILAARTRDFRTFSDPVVLVDEGTDVIDTTMIRANGRVYRFHKEEARLEGSRRLFADVGSDVFADDFRVIATRIGHELYADIEAPLVFKDNTEERWYLFLDQYSVRPQGYIAFTTTDLDSGDWIPVPPADFDLAPNTKHGGVIGLRRSEWERVSAELRG